MTGEEKKAARMAMVRLDKASATLRQAAGLASRAGAHDAHSTIHEAAGIVARAMAAIDSAIRMPSKGSAQARTLPLFK